VHQGLQVGQVAGEVGAAGDDELARLRAGN